LFETATATGAYGRNAVVADHCPGATHDQDVARRYAQAVLLTHPIEEFEHDFRRGAGHAVHPPSRSGCG
jgi:hypothetical protein